MCKCNNELPRPEFYFLLFLFNLFHICDSIGIVHVGRAYWLEDHALLKSRKIRLNSTALNVRSLRNSIVSTWIV